MIKNFTDQEFARTRFVNSTELYLLLEQYHHVRRVGHPSWDPNLSVRVSNTVRLCEEILGRKIPGAYKDLYELVKDNLWDQVLA